MRHQEPLELGHAQVDVVVYLQVEVRVHRGHRGAEPHHRLVRQLVVRVRVLQPEKVPVARDFRLQVPVQALVALHGLADHEPEQQAVLRLYLPQRRPGGKPRVSQDIPPRARREPGVHADKRQGSSSPPGFPATTLNVTACVTDPSARTPACSRPPRTRAWRASASACSRPSRTHRRARRRSSRRPRPSPNPSVLLHRSASPPSWCCSCAIALFWSRITRSLRRSSSASAEAAGHLLVRERRAPQLALETPAGVADEDPHLVNARRQRGQRRRESRARVSRRPPAASADGLVAARPRRALREDQEPVHEHGDGGGRRGAALARPAVHDARATPSTCPSKNGSDRDPDIQNRRSSRNRLARRFRFRCRPARGRRPGGNARRAYVPSPPRPSHRWSSPSRRPSIEAGPRGTRRTRSRRPRRRVPLRSSTSASRIREDWTIRARPYTEHSSENATTMAVCVRARTTPRPPGLLFVFILPPKGLAQPLRSARPPHGLFTGSRGFAGAAVAAVYPTALAPAATAALPATPPPACDARGGGCAVSDRRVLRAAGHPAVPSLRRSREMAGTYLGDGGGFGPDGDSSGEECAKDSARVHLARHVTRRPVRQGRGRVSASRALENTAFSSACLGLFSDLDRGS